MLRNLQVESQWSTKNEIRARRNLPPLSDEEGGEAIADPILLQIMNMKMQQSAQQQQQQQYEQGSFGQQGAAPGAPAQGAAPGAPAQGAQPAPQQQAAPPQGAPQ